MANDRRFWKRQQDRKSSDSEAAAMKVVGIYSTDTVAPHLWLDIRTRGLETWPCCGVLESGCAGAGEERGWSWAGAGEVLCRCPAWSWTLLTSWLLLRPAAATSKNRSGAMVVESWRPLPRSPRQGHAWASDWHTGTVTWDLQWRVMADMQMIWYKIFGPIDWYQCMYW